MNSTCGQCFVPIRETRENFWGNKIGRDVELLEGEIDDGLIGIKEALQKYPEQSFAQKSSLCNRQKLSERKIKEGF